MEIVWYFSTKKLSFGKVLARFCQFLTVSKVLTRLLLQARFGKVWEGSPESHPGQGGLHFARDAVEGGGCVHIGVEGLDVACSARQVEQNHGLVPNEIYL